MEITSTRTYRRPRWPNFLIEVVAAGKREDGLQTDGPKMSVGDLNDEQVEKLCEDFREHCRSRRKS